jgi:transcriptional regulator with XRE-family HTH domain
MSFRDNLRETLDFQGMEQKELAAKTGLSLKTIENYVKKDSSVPPGRIAAYRQHKPLSSKHRLVFYLAKVL